jgi:hypothetical protein
MTTGCIPDDAVASTLSSDGFPYRRLVRDASEVRICLKRAYYLNAELISIVIN